MTQYITIVLAIEDMTKFDVEFKSQIHGGKVVAMAKYDALAVADMACDGLKAAVDDGVFPDSFLEKINETKHGD
jgi:hypothetical protein